MIWYFLNNLNIKYLISNTSTLIELLVIEFDTLLFEALLLRNLLQLMFVHQKLISVHFGLTLTNFEHRFQNFLMFLVHLSDILLLFFLSFLIFLGFFLPDLSLDMIPFDLLLLPILLVGNLLNQVVFRCDLLLHKSFSSLDLIFEFCLFSGFVLSKNSDIFFLLLFLVVLDDSFCHHVHELALTFFTIGHFISTFLLLEFNKAGVFFGRFDFAEALFFIFDSLFFLVTFIFLKHCT